jgi:tRNA threonylcarbamoyladenosine biosynthesis protein TsaB
MALLPSVQRLLSEAGIDWQALDGIAFGRGPGAFTGLRTSCAVAQGLAFGLDVPVWPLDSLALVAEDARLQLADTDTEADADAAEVHAAVAMDARMGEVYAGAWHWQAGQGWQVVIEQGLFDPAGLAPLWARAWPTTAPGGGRRLLCGSALAVPALVDRWPALPAGVDGFAHERDRARALLNLALAAAKAGPGIAADAALPLYLRDKVAQTTAERNAARAASQA